MISAYRLSNEELNKIIWLKDIFERNGYGFDPDRFPEIYYDDLNQIEKELDRQLLDKYNNEDNLNPDLLGVYIPEYPSKGICSESKEGKIFLFKDRIERYVLRNFGGSPTYLTSVRFIVLMHELGHWLTHIGLKGGNYWNYGKILYPQTKRTHEAFAQLIAYWACEDCVSHLETLYTLSPKDISSGIIDSSNPYGGYIELVKFSKVSILQKLSEIRENWFLKDDIFMDFLKSSFTEIVEWAKSVNKDNISSVQAELIANKLNTDCSNVLNKHIDILNNWSAGFVPDWENVE